MAIAKGTPVRVEVPTQGRGIPITTASHGPLAVVRVHHRQKKSQRPGQFLFGVVLGGPYEEYKGQDPANQKYLIRWDGKRFRTSFLPGKLLMPIK
jgi:hypothetical protein